MFHTEELQSNGVNMDSEGANKRVSNNKGVLINPLSPSIHIQIPQTDLHTFPLRISWENLIKHQGIFSFVIIFYILTTLSLDNVWTLLGENCCWSLLGLKGLSRLDLKKMYRLSFPGTKLMVCNDEVFVKWVSVEWGLTVT